MHRNADFVSAILSLPIHRATVFPSTSTRRLTALERIIVSRFREDRLEPLLDEIEVSDDEVLRFYEENRETYTRPERLQIIPNRPKLS